MDASDLIPKLAVLAIAAFVIWALAQPRYTFVVTIKNGQAFLTRGKVPQRLLDEVSRVCQERHILSGEIKGLPRKRLSLVFSRSIPRESQQALRNVWCASG